MTQTSSRAAPTSRRPSWWLALVLVAGAIVYLPSIRSHYFLDDYVQAAMASDTFPLHRNPFDLYNFIDAADRPVLVARGMLPWWADPHLVIRFFRPLSSALIFAEHRMFGDGPLILHLHSLLWWVAVVVGARALFRRLLPDRPANLATAIFALAPCHACPLGWLANREVLICAAFGWPALAAYVRWRERGSVRHAALSSALFVLSFLAGEYALCFTGYVLAYEATGRDRLWKRVLGVLPFAAPAAAYLAVRASLGYGARGSGFYADPTREPIEFLKMAPRRLITLLLDGWFSLDHETLTGATQLWLILGAFFAAVALFGAPILRFHASLDRGPRRTARWLLLGSFLSLAPVTAVISSPRVLGVSMFGVAATVALFLEHTWFGHYDRAPRPAGERAESWIDRLPRPLAREQALTAALALGFAHLVHSPMTAYLVGRGFRNGAMAFAEQLQSLRSRMEGPEAREVVVLRGMDASLFLPWMDKREEAHPWRVLAQTGHVLALRQGPRTIELRVPRGAGAFSIGAGNLFRGTSDPMREGDVFTTPGMTVTIREVGADGPRRVSVELDRELESSSLLWVSEDRTGFPDAVLPSPGFGKPFDP